MQLELFITVLLIQNQVLVATASSSSEEDENSEHDGTNDKNSSHEHHWGYDDQEGWSSAFQHCSGQSQSPIDIKTSKVIYDSSLPHIELDGYDLKADPTLKLQNNGHTLQLSLPNTMRIVKGFDQVYLAAQLHFHWGTIAVPGSEHTIDNIHFPAEIHVVHYNSKYTNSSEAESKPDGLAVLGAFIGIGLKDNENYEKILSVLNDVSIEGVNKDPSEIKPRVTPSGKHYHKGMSRGDKFAIAFGALFIVTLLSSLIYISKLRKTNSISNKDTRQDVIYKPAIKDDV
ncbi:hypothetical protein P4O66_005757 [Electrophorus voltai]|uniref:Carbonic anhydrase n=1 Tax=Electrophorus voltai TaxID=2609070 RepID=A0AAD9E2Z9_9TELE|nr:hypothetical protein P4O66_005757 [Electrophorus voltai]